MVLKWLTQSLKPRVCEKRSNQDVEATITQIRSVVVVHAHAAVRYCLLRCKEWACLGGGAARD